MLIKEWAWCQRGLGLYSMSSILVDRAEPSEALSTTTVWSVGLPNSKKLVSSLQLTASARRVYSARVRYSRSSRGILRQWLFASRADRKSWSIVAEINQGPAKVRDLISYLKADNNIAQDIEADIALGSENLARIVGISDGLQVTEDKLSANHHFANVLFNVMRGGLFVDNYNVPKADFIGFVKGLTAIYTISLKISLKVWTNFSLQ